MQESGLLRCSLAEALRLGAAQGLPPKRLSWALKGSRAPFSQGICPAVLAESEKGRDGPEATVLGEDGEHEGGSPRSPCSMASESETQAIWLLVWLCGQIPGALGDCQAWKTANAPPPQHLQRAQKSQARVSLK